MAFPDPAIGNRRAASDELSRRTGAVVVAHSRTDLAVRCIQSLGAAVPAENVAVVVNAPDSADASDYEVLKKRVRVVSPPMRQGYGANLNLGVRSLPDDLDFLLLANDDVEFANGALKRLLAALGDDPDVGIAAPSLQSTAGEPEWAYAPFPTALGTVLNVALFPLGPARGPLSRKAGALVPAADDRGLPRNGWVCGAAMLVRADAYLSVGGFDEDFFLYFEETDFCFRVRQAGWGVVWVPDAPAVHLGGSATGDRRYRRIGLQHRRLYLLKRLGLARLVALQAAQLTIFVVAGGYNLVAAAIRPATARRRFAVLRDRYEDSRIFLLGSRIRS